MTLTDNGDGQTIYAMSRRIGKNQGDIGEPAPWAGLRRAGGRD